MSLIYTNQSVPYLINSHTICSFCDKDKNECGLNSTECFAQFEKDFYSNIFNGTSWICDYCSANGTSECQGDRSCQDKLKEAVYTVLARQNMKTPKYLEAYAFSKEKCEDLVKKLLDTTYTL